MKILTQRHQYSVKMYQSSRFNNKNAFSENKNFSIITAVPVCKGICVNMDTMLLVSGANFSSVPLLKNNNVLFPVSNSKRARRKNPPPEKPKREEKLLYIFLVKS